MNLFLKILNMSIAAGWLVFAVLLLRIVLRRAPKAINCLLWGLVAFRLICPFSIESALSLIPSAEALPQSSLLEHNPTIDSGISAIDSVVNPIFSQSFAATPMYSANPLQIYTFIAANVWVLGIVLLLLYALISFFVLRRKTRECIEIEKDVFVCDRINTPFILGIFRPQIFVPSGVKERDLSYVLSHERAHISRRDHLWKPLGFLLLSVYWFNPVMWLAYIVLCRDIELACDERVIKSLGDEAKLPYSDALINCSSPRRAVSVCPLAFGETGVKGRIKSVLNYKKPAFWITVTALLLSVITAVCFLTNPPEKTALSYLPLDGYTTHDKVDVSITGMKITEDEQRLFMSFTNNTGKELSFGEQFKLYRKNLGTKINCKKDKNEFWNELLNVINGESASRTINLIDYDLSHTGEYQLEFNFTVDGEGEFTAILPFKAEPLTMETQMPAASDPHELFDIKTAYAGWTEDERLYSGGLNPDGMSHEFTRRPAVYSFQSSDELSAFCENYKDLLAFSQGYDETSSVETVIAEYGDSIWTDHTLFAVYVTAPSGSIRYRVKSISNDGESLSFEITQSNHPQIFTDDMAGWLIFVPIPKTATQSCVYFDAYIS